MASAARIANSEHRVGMRLTMHWLAAMVLGVGLCSASATAANIAGRVRDANTASFLFGATVTIKELDRTVTTESDGSYAFANVPAGDYTLALSYIGYDDVEKPVHVSEDSEARADFTLGSEIVQLGRFVVEGEREGQARALQQKRYASNIVDIVSADSAGKLPDGNAAEAVRRLPGVYAEVDQNEGRYIVVRGIDASLNNITINGISVGSSEAGSRGAAMDAVPADLISRIEVVKAITPDMDAQAIGASINIVTPSAFDRAETFAYGTLAGGHYNGPTGEFEDNKTTPYSGSATFGTTFGDGKWGIVVGGSYNFRHYISNRQSGGNPWLPAAEDSDIYFPSGQSLFHYDVQRWRQGLNAALEFRPSDEHQFAFRVTNNQFKDEEGREQSDFDFFRSEYPDSYTDTTATFSKGRSTVEYRYYEQEHNITNYSFEGKHTLGSGDLKLDYVVAVGNAEKETPNRTDWEFRSGKSISSTVDTSSEYWTVTPSANYYDASTYGFRRVRFRHDEETEDNFSAAANLKREMQLLGHNGFWQVGGKYYSRDKAWDRTNLNYSAAGGAYDFDLSQFNLSTSAHDMFDGTVQMSPQIDLDAIRAFFEAHPEYFSFDEAGTVSNSYATDFGLKEEITAGYAMGKVNLGAFSVLAGVRVESSEADVTQTELPTAGSTSLAPRQNHFTKRYTNVLPGVHLRYQARKNWIFRAAWTNTIGRPNYPDIAGSSEFSYDETSSGSGTYTGSIESGNPDLKPYESMNFDLTSEYYFKSSGLFSVSLFTKRIDNPIFTNAYTSRFIDYAGMYFETLAYSRPENADHGRIDGAEFNYQQQFTMLPAPFDGLGFSVNYTVTDSEETLFSRPGEALPFTKQADRIYNAALFYEKYRWQARIAYTYTGAFATSYGSDVNSDSYQAERRIIDAKLSYRLTPNFTIFADVINLGEEPLDEYSGYAYRNSATEQYWWTANFGVNWKL